MSKLKHPEPTNPSQLLPFSNARLVTLSPSADSLLSYHPPVLHFYTRESADHPYRQKATIKHDSITAISLTNVAVLGTRHGGLFTADSLLATAPIMTLPGSIRAVDHTKNFLVAVTRSAIFMVRERKVLCRFAVSCVKAVSLVEWHAIGEVKRRASLAYVSGGNLVYIPDLKDGCEGKRAIQENVKYIRLHQTRYTDFLYLLGKKLRIFEVDMRGRIHSVETLGISGDTCAEWVSEGDGRIFVAAEIEDCQVRITTKRQVKGVRFQRESENIIHSTTS